MITCSEITRRRGALCQLACQLALLSAASARSASDAALQGLATDVVVPRPSDFDKALGLQPTLDAPFLFSDVEEKRLRQSHQQASLRGSNVLLSDRRPSYEAPTMLSQEITSFAEVQDTQQSSRQALAQLTAEQARVEAVQATADEAAAEAIAADELRTADRAAARAKAAWARVREAEEEALKLSEGFKEAEDASPLDSISLASFASSEEQQPSDVATPVQVPTNSSNSTADSRECNHDISMPCPLQRVITFDYKMSVTMGYAEWIVLALLWLVSVYMACCVCECGLQMLCCCQFLSCGGIMFLILATANSLVHFG